MNKRPGWLARSGSSAVLWSVVLGVVLLGWRTGEILIVAIFSTVAQWEFYSMQEQKGATVFKYLGIGFGLLFFVLLWYFRVAHPGAANLFPAWEESLFVLAVVVLLLRVVWGSRGNLLPLETAGLTLLGVVYVPFLFSFLCRIALEPNNYSEPRLAALFVVLVTKLGDTGAFIAGSLLGRHRLLPRISPKKTWEGLAGGLAAALLASLVIVFLCGRGLMRFRLLDTILLGLGLGFLGVWGDLAKSAAKRDAHVKDSGHWIPGIGGALDLVDSLLFTAPAFYFYGLARFGGTGAAWMPVPR
ncbi:Phosphatidate cytidylyltransferase [Methylacidimicrobium sp. AP8]|uniref:phosphatidate cytidylyltransferase n=1 Tax=Methylacidimicrobium sp. AP8 TaxID=2730359 RepID=UPI0018BFA045|nr:phosphatidate cytidylyltransferase [Methylacidimicrobium sp. AP8]CAB4242368.1 Phosphatidate cytidylyltransferase [Methylacidimicrobium sp. AP8]